MNKHGFDMAEMQNVLNKKSGVQGISGVSSDFRDLDATAAEGNPRSRLALDVFCYGVSKYIGAYAAAMGGVDAVIFTAGVGENGPETRALICEKLGFMGIALDQEANLARGKLWTPPPLGRRSRPLSSPPTRS